MAWSARRIDASLADIPSLLPRGNAKAVAEERRKELAAWQARLAAEGQRALLVLFQAMDSGGKDSTIRRVFRDCSMQGVHVSRFAVPSDEERAHDFLWRHHKQTPRAGDIGVWNRSHYESVVTEAVLGLVDDETLRRRLDHINAFERMLHDEGTRVVKFFLHISHDEQGRRLQRRLDRPDKRWKFDISDIEQRAHWNEHRAAYDAAMQATDSEHAPWRIVPADDKRVRDAIVASELVRALENMAPDYPERSDLPDSID